MKSLYSLPTNVSEIMKAPQVSVAIIVSLFKSETPLLDSPSLLTNNLCHPFANDDIVCAHNISKPSPPIVGHTPPPRPLCRDCLANFESLEEGAAVLSPLMIIDYQTYLEKLISRLKKRIPFEYFPTSVRILHQYVLISKFKGL